MPEVVPLILIVIPTRHRPDLVVRAVRSALDQTYEAFEVIVVVDGPDDLTVESPGEIKDSRLRVKILPHTHGSAEARNEGVKEARGRRVAFLDDDDGWLPQKLLSQLRVAEQSPQRYGIIGCRLIVHHEMGDLVWPTRLSKPNEPMSEYLFCLTKVCGWKETYKLPPYLPREPF